jgi:hypothetical protein
MLLDIGFLYRIAAASSKFKARIAREQLLRVPISHVADQIDPPPAIREKFRIHLTRVEAGHRTATVLWGSIYWLYINVLRVIQCQ